MVLAGWGEQVVVLVVHLMQLVQQFVLVCEPVAPVEEEVLHEEDEVGLQEDLPEGRELVEPKVYADDRREVDRNWVY